MRIALPVQQLLPALCPVCGAPGVVPRAVPRGLAGFLAPVVGEETTAHYCDSCDARLNRRATISYGILAALLIVQLSGATALPLALGTQYLAIQLLLTMGSGILLGTLWLAIGPPTSRHFGVAETARDAQHRELSVNAAGLAQSLLQVRGAVLRTEPAPRNHWSQRLWSENFLSPHHALGVLPLLLGILWVGGLQMWGDARARVLHAGDSELIVLVDGRRVATVESTHFEDPAAGRFVRLLGGRRQFTLLHKDGTPLSQMVVTIWPGRDYVVGSLPSNHCLYVETRQYGAVGQGHDWQLVRDTAPIWELPGPIDSWFQPLPSTGGPSPSPGTPGKPQQPALFATGGTRTALRLLSCNAIR